MNVYYNSLKPAYPFRKMLKTLMAEAAVPSRFVCQISALKI